MDIPDQVLSFFSRHAPFDSLASNEIGPLISGSQLTYLTAQNIKQQLPSINQHVFFIQSGHFDVQENGFRRQLGQGDFFNLSILKDENFKDIDILVEESGLVYCLPILQFKRLSEQHSSIANFFEDYTHKDLISPLDESSNIWLYQRIDRQLVKAPVTTESRMSVEQCAKVMAHENISSLLITENEHLIGILTDKDIRKRVVAAGLSPTIPVSEVMTASPTIIHGEASMLDALSMMTQHNIHHLPIVEIALKNGRHKILGMVTSSDILRAQRSNVMLVVNDIAKAESLYALINAAWQIPHYFKTYASRFSDFDIAGKVLSQATDIMTRKLIEFFIAKHGEPPIEYCWLVYGSQARGDQHLGSDQDNGLLLRSTPSESDTQYFAEFSEYVCGGLAKCGIKYCNGNIMAQNPELRQSLDNAIRQTQVRCDNPSEEAVMHFNIFLDIRNVSGDESLFEEYLRQRTQILQNSLFLAALARFANSVDVPLSLFRQFVYEKKAPTKECIDIKVKAVAIVNDIVRLYALADGVTKAGTVDRINALSDKCGLSETDRRNLKEIWLFLNRLRWRHQLTQNATDNYVSMTELSPFERYQLKKSFQHIKDAQQGLVMKFSGGMAN